MIASRAFAALLTLLTGIVLPSPAFSQEGGTVVSQSQVWLGYLTQARLSDDYSLWNDAHFVPGAFYVLRTGLGYHLAEGVTATAGFAYLGLPLGSVTRDLKRQEYRPWGQLVYSSPLAENWGFLHRVRYDARFRRNVIEEQLAPGFELTHRVRFLVTFRRDFSSLTLAELTPYVTVGNEVLLNWVPKGARLDQNRVTAGVGVSRGGLSVQVGYMNRHVQLASGTDFVTNHTLLVWVFHNFDLRRSGSASPEVPVSLP